MEEIPSLTEIRDVKIAIESFNRGDIAGAMKRFADDVEIVIPIYRVGETAGDMRMRGKVELRRLLEQRRSTGVPMALLSFSQSETGALITLNSSVQGEVAVAVRYNNDGLVSHMSVFKT